MKKIIQMAERLHIRTGSMSKSDLICAIQELEQGEACFDCRTIFCNQHECPFYDDCVTVDRTFDDVAEGRTTQRIMEG